MYPKYPTGPMMQPAQAMHPHFAPQGVHAPHAHGFCASCCHPAAQCTCHRSCRKIEKELLVGPNAAGGGITPGKIGKGAHNTAASDDPARAKAFALMDLISPPEATAADMDEKAAIDAHLPMRGASYLRQAVAANKAAIGMKDTVIGGGCCVHLSIEYMQMNPLVPLTALAGVLVIDSKATMMAWGKMFTDDGYHVKECIISTQPGAHLVVLSINAITRVRWCEIISC
ncbi:MAG: hypothetical protein EPN14_09305 [Gallionella sp.]|nr:MAG: hypothetical protein EPN14_09305 [Gallionella sp.]